MAGLREEGRTAKTKTYINVVNVEDFRLEEQAESPGLLNGVSQLTVRLGTGTAGSETPLTSQSVRFLSLEKWETLSCSFALTAS